MAKRTFLQSGINGAATVTSPKRHASFKSALLSSMTNPELKLFEDESVVVIKDKYPKARVHLLVLPKKEIPDVASVKPRDLELLRHMQSTGERMAAGYGPLSDFRLGYHSCPSLSRLHLHVISQDFDSVCLKTKKHWNSFTSRFFVDSKDVIAKLEREGRISIDRAACEKLLRDDMRCHRCGEFMETIPKLKTHIRAHDTHTTG